MERRNLDRFILGGCAGFAVMYAFEDLYANGLGLANILTFPVAGATMSIASRN